MRGRGQFARVMEWLISFSQSKTVFPRDLETGFETVRFEALSNLFLQLNLSRRET